VKRIRIGLVGIGKIARDQHIPSLQANPIFELVAWASRNAQLEGLPGFPTAREMLDSGPALDAIAICTPPAAHYETACLALARGKHVLLEKPPCATMAEFARLTELGRGTGQTLYQTWHSRHAAAVAPARTWLAGRKVRHVEVIWKEDVRHWHPGQTWIWQAGGFGVFDPGINALSILTEILPGAVFVESADLFVPENCESPIAANLSLTMDGEARIAAAFDFRHTGVQTWDIKVETDDGVLSLSMGGGQLALNGVGTQHDTDPHGEYKSIYRRFAELIGQNRSEADGRPFQLVADAFMIGRRHTVEAFIE
jgi:D-galactose 1-dehydrogenase